MSLVVAPAASKPASKPDVLWFCPLAADGEAIEVEVNGARLKAKTRGEGLKKGEKCVLAIRPEFLTLAKKPENSNSWSCEVVNASFVGDTMRYDIKAENGATLLAKAPTSSYESGYTAGDKLYVTLPEEYLLTYRQPEEGLEKALSLE